MKKKIFITILITFSLIIGGCSFNSEEIQEIEQNEENNEPMETTSIISPAVKLSEKYYRGVLPYKHSSVNGMLKEIPNRYDNKYFELGLIELAKTEYDPSTYIFQEGQILTMNEIEPLLDSTQYPQYENFVYAISEHDYLLENGEYGGVMIGLLVSPKYYEKEATGEYIKDDYGSKVEKYYTEEELKQKSKQLAEEIVSLVRRKVPETPITIGVMQSQTDDMKTPGEFFLKGTVEAKNHSIKEWESINETYLFLPSNLKIDDPNADLVKTFNYFKDNMNEYLPEYAGVTGLARLVDGDLVELTIKSYAEFDSTSEVIQYTQFGIAMIDKFFPDDIQINFYVNTLDKPKSIYVRKADGNDFMHIYRD